MDDTAGPVEEIASKAREFDDSVLFIGDGAHKNREIIMNSFGQSAKFLDKSENYTAGIGAARLAQKYFDEGKILSPAQLLPYYFKDTAAKKKFK
jgi:tRNA A37 threonylcarbamoyladenosine modification protein TsaB